MSGHLPLPSAVGTWAAEHLAKCSHFGLRHQTYFAYPEPWGFKPGGSDKKSEVWGELMGHAEHICKGMQPEVDGANARRKRMAQALAVHWGVEGRVVTFTGEVAWRLALGLGNEHPLENGMTLHRSLGLPYLPGSALKGLARRWALTGLAEEFDIPLESDRKALTELHHKRRSPLERFDALVSVPEPKANDPATVRKREKLREVFDLLAADLEWQAGAPSFEEVRARSTLYRRAFGSQDSRGEVCFLDALPESSVVKDKPIITHDVVTPHHQEYYGSEGKSAPPADWDAPVPSAFLAVRKGARFGFLLHGPCMTVVEQAAAWLKEALQKNGFGAKTTAGYGELRLAQDRGCP